MTLKPLLPLDKLQQILEKGLVGGYWSISEFNRGQKPPTFPRPGFLTEHPEFFDKDFRDLETYRNNPNRRIF